MTIRSRSQMLKSGEQGFNNQLHDTFVFLSLETKIVAVYCMTLRLLRFQSTRTGIPTCLLVVIDGSELPARHL